MFLIVPSTQNSLPLQLNNLYRKEEADMRPRNKVELNSSHPYAQLKKKKEKKRATKLLLGHSRNSALFISFVYLFAPLLLVVPATNHGTPKSFSSPPLANLIFDGMGGPAETAPKNIQSVEKFTEYLEEENFRFDIVNSAELQPLVVITKILNHLKVSDTVMPTISPEISSNYGWRTPPCKGCSSDHKGVDFVPGYGTPIFTIADGLVIDMGRNGGYGNYIKIQHLMGNSEGIIEEWVTLYAHIKDNSFPDGLKIGSVVKKGETIAAVGNTGMSTGPHLHFELIVNGEHVDPLPLLGTYKVIVVTEEDYPDYMFVGETFKRVETVVRYE